MILKLRYAVDDLAYPADDAIHLTRLALVHGFYDQAHFIHSFRTIVNTSPGKFHPPDYVLAFKK